MQASEIDVLIKKTVTPKATASSLLMCVTFLAKSDMQAVDVYLQAVCRSDLYKAALLLRRLSGKPAEICRQWIDRELSQCCEESGALTQTQLLTILELDAQPLFRKVSHTISEEMVEGVFSKASAAAACRLMGMILACDLPELYPMAERCFCAFLNRYDSSGDEALKELLPLLFRHNASTIIFSLIDTVGSEHLEVLYGDGLWEELEQLILLGEDSAALWDLFCSRFFSKSRSVEELLTEGLWYIQLFATDCDEAASIFYLYAAKHLSVAHPIFDHMDCFEVSENFCRKHILIYRELIRTYRDDPCELAHFLSRTWLCNPYARQFLPENSYSLLSDTTGKDPQQYNMLDQLFRRSLDSKTILDIFFQSDLKYELPLEDLLYLAQRYERLDPLLEQLSQYTFTGEVVKYQLGSIILDSKCYRVLTLPSVRIRYNELADILGDREDPVGTRIEYQIVSFRNGQFRIQLMPKPYQNKKNLGQEVRWDKVVWKLHCFCGDAGVSLQDYPRLPKVLEPSAETFGEKNDFGLITALISAYPERINQFLEMMRGAKWNIYAQQTDLRVPGLLFVQLEKYREDAVDMLRKLISWGLPYKKILALYFGSLYKLIVPLDTLLMLGNRDMLLRELRDIPICLQLGEGTNRFRGHLLNVCCPRICYVDNAGELYDLAVIHARCVDYTVADGAVFMIRFQGEMNKTLTGPELGALYGYLANNTQISNTKRDRIARLPAVQAYSKRELILALRCMEDAVFLRRLSNVALLELLDTLGEKNPYDPRFDTRIRIGATYVLNLKNPERQKRNLNIMVSVILNARQIGEIGDIYLRTGLKYYIRITQLVSMILDRRPEFARQLPELFSSAVFRVTADSTGNVWSPYLPQGCVTVDIACGDRYLVCRITPDEKGKIDLQIQTAEESDSRVFPVALCLLLGYQVPGQIIGFVQSFLEKRGFLTHLLPQERKAVLEDPDALARLLIRLFSEYNWWNPR